MGKTMQYKIRSVTADTTETIEAPSLLEAAKIYCKNNEFDIPVEYRHSVDDVFTLLSANRSANVIGNFQIYEHA